MTWFPLDDRHGWPECPYDHEPDCIGYAHAFVVLVGLVLVALIALGVINGG